jgi:hypothetical protein
MMPTYACCGEPTPNQVVLLFHTTAARVSDDTLAAVSSLALCAYFAFLAILHVEARIYNKHLLFPHKFCFQIYKNFLTFVGHGGSCDSAQTI